MVHGGVLVVWLDLLCVGVYHILMVKNYNNAAPPGGEKFMQLSLITWWLRSASVFVCFTHNSAI